MSLLVAQRSALWQSWNIWNEVGLNTWKLGPEIVHRVLCGELLNFDVIQNATPLPIAPLLLAGGTEIDKSGGPLWAGKISRTFHAKFLTWKENTHSLLARDLRVTNHLSKAKAVFPSIFLMVLNVKKAE